MDSNLAIALSTPVRRKTLQTCVVWDGRVVTLGGDAPVRFQSMTNTDTADAIGTAIHVKELAIAGSEMVRITVNTPEAAQAVPYVREQLDRVGIDVPLIGDFHFNGHRLLAEYPECAKALSKYRINPGNVGKGDKRDKQFSQMVEAALRWDKPIRIGVNWGSLDQELLASMIGISLSGTGEAPAAPVFIDGEKRVTLRGDSIATDFQNVVEDYIQKRFGTSAEQATL